MSAAKIVPRPTSSTVGQMRALIIDHTSSPVMMETPRLPDSVSRR